MTLEQAIKTARGSRSHERFAAVIGCSAKSIARWERGLTVPGIEAHIQHLESEGVPTPLLRGTWPTQGIEQAR